MHNVFNLPCLIIDFFIEALVSIDVEHDALLALDNVRAGLHQGFSIAFDGINQAKADAVHVDVVFHRGDSFVGL